MLGELACGRFVAELGERPLGRDLRAGLDRGGEGRTGAEVIGTCGHRQPGQLRCVGGGADQEAFAGDSARRGERQVVRSEVDAIRPGLEGDIEVIVDDKQPAGKEGDRLDRLEKQLDALLKEVKSLRGEKPTAAKPGAAA